jgi:hypothetical protein
MRGILPALRLRVYPRDCHRIVGGSPRVNRTDRHRRNGNQRRDRQHHGGNQLDRRIPAGHCRSVTLRPEVHAHVQLRESVRPSAELIAPGYWLRFGCTWAKPLANEGYFVNQVKKELMLKRRGNISAMCGCSITSQVERVGARPKLSGRHRHRPERISHRKRRNPSYYKPIIRQPRRAQAVHPS